MPKPEINKNGQEKAPKKKDIFEAIRAVITKYPEILEYYIKFKEDNEDQASSLSQENVKDIETLFISNMGKFIKILSKETSFYDVYENSLQESYKRVMFLKNVIENKDGYRVFYNEGKPLKREADLQIMWECKLKSVI